MGKLHKLVAGTAVMSAVAIGFTALADADTYTVKSGDTLWDIARNNGTTVDQLMKDNNLSSDLIFPGDQLSFQNTALQVAEANNSGTYKVVLGDTLSKVATKFDTTVDDLVSLNKISNPNLIVVGQNLIVKKVENNPNSNTADFYSKKEEVKIKPVVELAPKSEVVEVKKEEVKPVATPTPEVKKEEAKTVVTPTPEVKKEEVKPVATPTPEVKKEEVKTTPVSTTVSNKGAAIIAAARAQLGVYQDCTMLVTNALRSVGINYHGWPAGYISLGTIVSADQAQPGDLVYYANGGMGLAHIAVYAGNGQAVHGGWFGNQTSLASVNIGSGPVFIRVR